MSHWRDRLREADRALTSELSPEETQRLRRTVVAEAASAARSRRRWSLPFVLTAGSLTAASAALVLSTVTALPGATAPPAGDLATAGEIAPERAGRRQRPSAASIRNTRRHADHLGLRCRIRGERNLAMRNVVRAVLAAVTLALAAAPAGAQQALGRSCAGQEEPLG